jgi:acyl carrier protein
MDHIPEIREFMKNLLAIRHDKQPFSDTSSLFLSGRLSSVDAVELVVFLEEKYGVDFTKTGFDESMIDSVDTVASLVGTAKAAD